MQMPRRIRAGLSMMLPEPIVVTWKCEQEIGPAIEAVPPGPAVFMVLPREGDPYIGRTMALRRRLKRLLRPAAQPSRLLNLRAIAREVHFWPAGSRLALWIYAWQLARRHYPETYRSLVKLRLPAYVKLILSNRFPRTQVTRRLSSRTAQFFGPFRTRAAAERFESEFLDLFQIRRCEEDLKPSPDHPGCIYGEMNRCLRPCQQIVGVEEYRSEVHRVQEFLATSGQALLKRAAAARDQASDRLEFEEAARLHQRYERIRQVLRLRDELAADIDQLHGTAVTPSPAADTVDLWFLVRGAWLPPHRFPLTAAADQPVSMDKRLREIVETLEAPAVTTVERQEHLAILASWYYSGSCDGEWIRFESLSSVPYRKLVNAIHRVAVGSRPVASRLPNAANPDNS